MKTLHKYLLREVIASLAMTLLVFTFVLLLGNVLRDILPLLVNQQATFGMVAKAIALLIPFVWVFALPIGMLTATLLVFGRFSADQELTAARASGVSLMSLVTPILVFSLLLCALCAAINLEIAPRCRVAFNSLRFQLGAAALANIQLPEGRPVSEFPGFTIYVGKNRNGVLQDILLYQLKDGTNIDMSVRAPRGRIELQKEKQQLILHLYDATIEYLASGMAGVSSEATFTLNLRVAAEKAGEPGLSDMTFLQLRERLRDWDARTARMRPTNNSPETIRRFESQARKWAEITEPIRVQIHQLVAFSFACFSFALVGIPLGIRVHRRETNVGIAVALLLVAVYYALMILANSQSTHAQWFPHLWMWAPNLLFQTVGVILLCRANRGGTG